MRLVVAAGIIAGCIPTYPIDATTAKLMSANEAETIVRYGLVEAAQLVIAKLGERGFTLVDSRRTDRGLRLKLTGNRDFAGTHTLGSVFYVSIERATSGRSQVRIVGKPTYDHREGCPTVEGEPPCTKIETWERWGYSGREEVQVIRGVFAEIALDGMTSNAVAERRAP
jgi:hypothetical protein